ncbi:MAG: hypothetical protein ACI9TZ_002862, partial [Yoonia sp.]
MSFHLLELRLYVFLRLNNYSAHATCTQVIAMLD